MTSVLPITGGSGVFNSSTSALLVRRAPPPLRLPPPPLPENWHRHQCMACLNTWVHERRWGLSLELKMAAHTCARCGQTDNWLQCRQEEPPHCVAFFGPRDWTWYDGDVMDTLDKVFSSMNRILRVAY